MAAFRRDGAMGGPRLDRRFRVDRAPELVIMDGSGVWPCHVGSLKASFIPICGR